MRRISTQFFKLCLMKDTAALTFQIPQWLGNFVLQTSREVLRCRKSTSVQLRDWRHPAHSASKFLDCFAYVNMFLSQEIGFPGEGGRFSRQVHPHGLVSVSSLTLHPVAESRNIKWVNHCYKTPWHQSPEKISPKKYVKLETLHCQHYSYSWRRLLHSSINRFVYP
jgi:hypothetical protein